MNATDVKLFDRLLFIDTLMQQFYILFGIQEVSIIEELFRNACQAFYLTACLQDLDSRALLQLSIAATEIKTLKQSLLADTFTENIDILLRVKEGVIVEYLWWDRLQRSDLAVVDFE